VKHFGILNHWNRLTLMLNQMSRSMAVILYPFTMPSAVLAKLQFIHLVVTAGDNPIYPAAQPLAPAEPCVRRWLPERDRQGVKYYRSKIKAPEKALLHGNAGDQSKNGRNRLHHDLGLQPIHIDVAPAAIK
jgi:hypothetical protein